MDASILSLLIWLPFAATLLISLLLNIIKGIKKGMPFAIISIATTVISALLSFLSAKLLAFFITPRILPLFPLDELPLSEILSAEVLSVLIEAVLFSVLTMILFSLVYLIMTIIISCVAESILSKKEKSSASPAAPIIAGISALLFTLIFCLPIYGTVAVYMPAAAELMDEGLIEENDLLDSAADHPLVQLYGAKPVAAVYNALAQTNIGGVSVSIAEVSDTVEFMITPLMVFITDSDVDDVTDAGLDLVSIMHTVFVEEEWGYALVVSCSKAAENSLPKELALYKDVLTEISEMSREDFTETFEEYLDFAEFALENDAIAAYKYHNYKLMDESGITAEFIELMNDNDLSVEIKQLVVNVTFENRFDSRKDLQTFAKKYPLKKLTGSYAQKTEAELFFRMFGIGPSITFTEFITRHPSLGSDAHDYLVENGVLAS